MRSRMLLPCLILSAVLYGCGGEGDKTGEVSVPEVQQADQTEQAVENEGESGQAEAQPIPVEVGTEPGTVLGEEEVILMELDFYAYSYDADSETPVFVKISETEGASAESLADQYVVDSNEECLVEEVTIGEGEYPAIWVSYAEGTDSNSRTCDLYIFRYNERLYTVQMDCFVEAYEGMGAAQESILSTLRFDEG